MRRVWLLWKKSLPIFEANGWETKSVFEVGNPYISCARSMMLRKALDIEPDAIVFIDHDLSWAPEDLYKLVATEGDVVAGTYRFKTDEEKYMGYILSDDSGMPIARGDRAVSAFCVPAGFLKITKAAINKFMDAYPELVYGDKYRPFIDLFNHGAHEGVWYGEDYAFSRNWRDLGEPIWLVPDLDLTHHTGDTEYPGNFCGFLMRQPGGSEYKEIDNVCTAQA